MKIQQKETGQMFITLQTILAKGKGWKSGDDLKPEINNKGDLVLKKK